MNLRPRRSRALQDISNVAENAADSNSDPARKRTRTSVSRDEVDGAAPVAAPVRNTPPAAPAIAVTPPPTTSTSPPALPFTSRKDRVKKTDPSHCLDIVDAMYHNFYNMEEKYYIAPYITGPRDISYRMRTILVDWLVEVHYKFRLQPPTLWLTVNILDRYLARTNLMRNRLQLVGITSFLIACKFEEIFAPEVKDCVFIADNGYSREEILAMEQSILTMLDYEICVPTTFHFLTRYANLTNVSDRIRFLAFYYAERCLQEKDSLEVLPSHLAAAAMYCALKYQATAGTDAFDGIDIAPPANADTAFKVWPAIVAHESGYSEEDVLPLAKKLVHFVTAQPVLNAQRQLVSAKKKYLHDRYLNVAEICPVVL